MQQVVVSCHPPFGWYLRRRGYIDNETRVIQHPGPEDVRRKRVIIGDALPFELAAEAAEILSVPVNVPPYLRGRELSASQIARYAGEPARYVVRHIRTECYKEEVEMRAMRALCSTDEWDAATARARTSRANQDPPRWADPTSLDIQEEVRYVWAIVPAPSPIAAREAGCDVELNERGELLGVAWSFGHFAVGEDGALAVGPDQRHEMRRLRSLAQALHVPVEADVEADLDRLGARKGQIKARLVEVDG